MHGSNMFLEVRILLVTFVTLGTLMRSIITVCLYVVLQLANDWECLCTTWTRILSRLIQFNRYILRQVRDLRRPTCGCTGGGSHFCWVPNTAFLSWRRTSLYRLFIQCILDSDTWDLCLCHPLLPVKMSPIGNPGVAYFKRKCALFAVKDVPVPPIHNRTVKDFIALNTGIRSSCAVSIKMRHQLAETWKRNLATLASAEEDAAPAPTLVTNRQHRLCSTDGTALCNSEWPLAWHCG